MPYVRARGGGRPRTPGGRADTIRFGIGCTRHALTDAEQGLVTRRHATLERLRRPQADRHRRTTAHADEPTWTGWVIDHDSNDELCLWVTAPGGLREVVVRVDGFGRMWIDGAIWSLPPAELAAGMLQLEETRKAIRQAVTA